MKERKVTRVIFRLDPHGYNTPEPEVIALMPFEASTDNPYECTAYAHVGQHFSVNPVLAMRCTRPATQAEYAPLFRELERAGYQLRVGQRANSQAALKARRAQIERG